jgi:hypothetical protein
MAITTIRGQRQSIIENPDRKRTYDEAVQSLARMHNFDTSILPRSEILGEAFTFERAVEPANELLSIYKQIPVEVLDSLSLQLLSTVRDQANADYNILNSILDFSPDTSNPKNDHSTRIDQLINAYDPTFERLYPIISYSVRKSTDFEKLERDARKSTQAVADLAKNFQLELEENKKTADQILAEIRNTAAEQGVSQQAIYFKIEADENENQAEKWLWRTGVMTVILLSYAVLSIGIHKISYLTPNTTFEAAQLAVSKILIFATISFYLFLSSRNYAAFRHNSVVNRHRQNALVTFKALVDAAGEMENRDIVLTKAAECNFAPQTTAFSKLDGGEGSYSVVNISSGAIKPSANIS